MHTALALGLLILAQVGPPAPSPQTPQADTAAPLPPDVPPKALPAPATTPAVPAAKAPTLADTAAPPASPTPVQIPITLHVTPTVVAAVPAPVAPAPAVVPTTMVAVIRHPGLIRRAIGRFGEQLATVGHDRIFVPHQPATVTVSQAAPSAAIVYVPATSPVVAQAVMATPQSQAVLAAPRKGLFGRVW